MDKLVMVGLHTQPTSAVAEIDALVDVVAWAEKVSNNSLANTLHYLYLLLFLCSYVPYFPQKKLDDVGAVTCESLISREFSVCYSDK